MLARGKGFGWPKLIWLAVGVVGLLLITALLPTTLTSPQDVSQPRSLFVIDHGTHSSIAIETDSGEMVRYAYGDLNYYAQRDTSLGSGAAALLWPTPATLGRGELPGPATRENLAAQLKVVVEVFHKLEVAGTNADQLMADLDQIHLAGKDNHIDVPAYGLVFAPHPTNYFWAHNSSTVIAGWLRDAGVSVWGWGLLASWSSNL